MILEIFLATISFFITLAFYLRRRPKDFPAGPVSWPVFGNMFQVGVEPYKSVMNLRKKYGDIIGIDLGSRRGIFLNEYKILKEAYSMPEFVARPIYPHYADPITGILRGFAFTSGKTWKVQRKFLFSYIQSAIRNEENCESLLMPEVIDLIDQLKKSSGTPIDTRHAFNISVVNSLWSMIAGKRYSIDDPAVKKVANDAATIVSSPLMQGILAFFPGFSKMCPKLSGFESFLKNYKPILEFMKNIVDEHKGTYKEGTERDYVDSYLKKIKSTTDENSSFFGESGEKNLIHGLADVFFGGTDTVSSTLDWLLFLMAHFPELQKKLITLIKLRLGHQKNISLKDRESLPYIEAVIQEVLRFSSLVPLGVFHETAEDVQFHGYKIPKGTMIVANQYGILHDPEVWEDPENFHPERFLSEDGSEIIHHPALVPFGAGRRICPGEAFARDQLFLIISSLFQNFRVDFDPSRPTPPLKYDVGNTLAPVDHRIIFYKLSY